MASRRFRLWIKEERENALRLQERGRVQSQIDVLRSRLGREKPPTSSPTVTAPPKIAQRVSPSPLGDGPEKRRRTIRFRVSPEMLLLRDRVIAEHRVQRLGNSTLGRIDADRLTSESSTRRDITPEEKSGGTSSVAQQPT